MRNLPAGADGSLYEWGCVHGRFQPFHLGHLQYVLRAKVRCRRLAVGITNPEPSWALPERTDAHRHEPAANPFTYFERALMVRDSLLGAGFDVGEFIVVPFPIQEPDRIPSYAPANAVHFVRVYSDWEREKVRRLRTSGLTVEILDPDEKKEVSGTQVREALRCGLPWEHLLPAASADVVRRILLTEPGRFPIRK